MNSDQINETISNYDKLIALAKDKIKILEKADTKYSTLRGIETITFEDDKVWVKCDDSCRGSYDSHYFDFPISFLSLSDTELTNEVTLAKELKLENDRKIVEEKKIKNAEIQEEKDLILYNKLKAKFEQNK